MLKFNDGTTVRDTPGGKIAEHGNRKLFLQGTSVAQGAKANKLLAAYSFDKLFKHGKKNRLLGPNVAYIRL
ncbi:hypothetical protein ACWPM6_11700 (plasmid) [Propionibacterium freudenreichii]|uniref:hypothetical protein n=1 Tax=Propionibacterium freudenreichii TaxID=1744 RepID=UPI00255142E9|nr:hypothetical protein [Propionibacterium freudenreichii]MDK9339769.1 hypothetical protein [Propionibacterium freudenreichii]MDK9352067.1 hypothetical protein [Propionibacterium freudenreichii]